MVGRAGCKGRVGRRSWGYARKHEISGPREDREARVLKAAARELEPRLLCLHTGPRTSSQERFPVAE